MNNRTETTMFPKTTRVFDVALERLAPKGGRGLGDHPSRSHFGSIIKFWLVLVFFFGTFWVFSGTFAREAKGA